MLSAQAQTIREIARSGLPHAQMRERFLHLQPYMQEAIEAEKTELQTIMAQRDASKRDVMILEGLEAWLKGPTTLERNEHTRAHKLVEALQRGDVLNTGGVQHGIAADTLSTAHVFVVRHDWAAALGQAIEAAGGEVSLPFSSCIFEFMMSGRCVIVWAVQVPGEQAKAIPFVETSSGWWCGGEDDVATGTPFHSAWLQIVAICVALDSEVATHEVVRAPAALNKKRERSGKPHVKDYHVVDLSRRHRVAGPCTGTNRSPRLHFRRGHWRHYDEHKTWIRWTMVGDPDMGFVKKHYLA